MSRVEIQTLARSGNDLRRFLRFSYEVYRDDPLWVAPLLGDLSKVFRDENPLFEHAEMQL